MAEAKDCVRSVIDMNKILYANDGDQVGKSQNEFESNGQCSVQLPKALVLFDDQSRKILFIYQKIQMRKYMLKNGQYMDIRD